MRGGALAVVVGSALGVAAAVAVHQSAEPDVRALSSEPRRSGPKPVASASSPGAAETSGPTPAPVVPATTSSAVPPVVADSASAEQVPSTAPAGALPSASAAPPPNLPEVPPVPPVTTAKEVEQAEVRCYQRRPDECDRAADAYDTGTLLPRDQERATKLRKVAFTYRVRACENRSPHACLVLAGRYEAGAGVERDSRKAKLLFEHARELCSRKPNVECAGGEPR